MVKILVGIIICLISIESFGQVPDYFNYQAVIRDNSGELVASQNVDIRVSIIDNTSGGTVLYTETHSGTTSENGLVNIKIGNGTVDLGTFSGIDWTNNNKYLQIEIDLGSGFVDMGTVQLLSVPYAFYAKNVENTDDADANPTNEIQDISLSGTDLSITSGSTVDLGVLQDGVDDADNNPGNELQTLSLDADTLEISDGNKIVFPYDSSRWVISGDQIYYNTGNVGIGSANPVSNLEVKANTAGSDALFQVINANNDTVFAVYPDGVKIFVDSEAKGKVGGFAVSGRNPAKAGEVDILRVTIDSTRIYVNDTATTKGKVGGFAVSGRNPAKGGDNNILFVTGDSTRIYVNNSSGTKGKVGGFAVSGRNPAKGTNEHMFITTSDSTRVFTHDAEGGFGVRDNSTGSSQSYLQLTPLNYFIGHESGINITTGSYNSFMGYKSGRNTSTGDNNVFLGYQTGFNNTEGFNNVFIGYNSGFSNIDGYRNVFIGYDAGRHNTSGYLNTFIGNVAGTNSTEGAANTIIGNYAGYNNVGGDENVFVGQSAGFGCVSGSNNIYIGRATGYYNKGGNYNAYVGYFSGYSDTTSTFNVFLGPFSGYSVQEGTSNVFIGKYAGYNETSVSNKLIISNSQTKNLIEGDFSNDKVTIRDVLKLTPRSSAPSDPVEGEIYVDSTTHHIYCYLNGGWVALDN